MIVIIKYIVSIHKTLVIRGLFCRTPSICIKHTGEEKIERFKSPILGCGIFIEQTFLGSYELN